MYVCMYVFYDIQSTVCMYVYMMYVCMYDVCMFFMIFKVRVYVYVCNDDLASQ